MIKQNNLKIIVLILIFITFVFFIFIEIYFRNNPSHSLEIRRNSQIEFEPSCAVFFFQIESYSPSEEEAFKDNLNFLLDFSSVLRKEGFDDYSILNLDSLTYLDFENSFEKFVTQNNFKLEVPLDKRETILDIFSYNFSSGIYLDKLFLDICETEKSTVELQLTSSSIGNAKENALSISQGLGRDLGKLLKINLIEINFNPILVYDSEKKNEQAILFYLDENNKILQKVSSEVICLYELV